jgi:hypothetical protein
VLQVTPNITRAKVDSSVASRESRCTESDIPSKFSSYWCIEPVLWSVSLDYDLGTVQVGSFKGDKEKMWEVTFDAIGGHDGLMKDPVEPYNRTDQKMVKVVVTGMELEDQGPVRDPQTGSTLFGSPTGGTRTRYKLEITEILLVERSYTFPESRSPTFWSKFKHFFGYDPAPPANHYIYHRDDWGGYGKKGTLKDIFGSFVHADWWPIVFIVLGSVIGGLSALYGLYRLFFWVREQRRLMQWGGIDELWQQMRRDGGDEDAALLNDRYRDFDGYHDDPDELPPPRYSAELPVNKPLPSKPLPDKPLPAVPLIDDV